MCADHDHDSGATPSSEPAPSSEIAAERRNFLKGAMLAGTAASAATLGVSLVPSAAAQDAAARNQRSHWYVPATDKTVHWGYFSKALKPILEVRSGDLVTIETLTHCATDDEAITLMSIAVDFGVTQVVDGNWGVHAIIKKSLFAGAVA